MTKHSPFRYFKTSPEVFHLATLGPLKRNRNWVRGYVGCEGLQDGHLYSRTNFKLNRATALAEWRQLLSA